MEPSGLLSATEENEQMVTRELEAAEALAGLARCSGELESPGKKLVQEPTATPARRRSQDQAIVVQQSFEKTSTMLESASNTEQTSTSYLSNSASKLRQNLSEAEKEARRLRRVLANRESARQTIRRRQVMHLELIRKAADLLQENENLKKENKLAMEEYTLLKRRNEFLKLQIVNVRKARLANVKKAEPRVQAEIAANSAIPSCPMFLYNQPSLLPLVWPSILPSSNVLELQCVFSSDVMSASQFPLQLRDIPLFHEGQEICSGITRLGNPLFVLPVPWLLPFLGCGSTLHSHSDTNKKENEVSSDHKCSMSTSSDTQFVGDNHQLSLNGMEAPDSTRTVSVGSVNRAGLNFLPGSSDDYTWHHPKATLVMPETLSYIRPVKRLMPARDSQKDGFYDLNAVSASEHILQSSHKNNQESSVCCHKESEGVFTASKARMRRKELVKLKNINCHRARTCSINY